MYVFIVHHVHQLAENADDVKLIGVYSTEESARAAITRLSLQPGFCETASGFQLERYSVDEDHWTEGFVTVRGDD